MDVEGSRDEPRRPLQLRFEGSLKLLVLADLPYLRRTMRFVILLRLYMILAEKPDSRPAEARERNGTPTRARRRAFFESVVAVERLPEQAAIQLLKKHSADTEINGVLLSKIAGRGL